MPKLECGCTPDASGYGYCSECTRSLRKKIWGEMSEKDRNYDRHFAPSESAELDRALDIDPESQGCSCHINPPCDYCVGRDDEDEQEAN